MSIGTPATIDDRAGPDPRIKRLPPPGPRPLAASSISNSVWAKMTIYDEPANANACDAMWLPATLATVWGKGWHAKATNKQVDARHVGTRPRANRGSHLQLHRYSEDHRGPACPAHCDIGCRRAAGGCKVFMTPHRATLHTVRLVVLPSSPGSATSARVDSWNLGALRFASKATDREVGNQLGHVLVANLDSYAGRGGGLAETRPWYLT